MNDRLLKGAFPLVHACILYTHVCLFEFLNGMINILPFFSPLRSQSFAAVVKCNFTFSATEKVKELHLNYIRERDHEAGGETTVYNGELACFRFVNVSVNG